MEIKIEHNKQLEKFNTFKVAAIAKYFTQVNDVDELVRLIEMHEFKHANKRIIIGNGSNMLFICEYFDGIVVKINILGKQIVDENEDEILIKFGSGEQWHEIVEWCVERSYSGVENLALIPGSVGAAPIQNIGAYGVELESVLDKIETIEVSTGNMQSFDKIACEFGYRDSVFKRRFKDLFIITNVYLRLNKKPKLNTEYAELKKELGNIVPTIGSIFTAVVAIRQRKLPDFNEIGNAGSFFKNPIVSATKKNNLLTIYPNLISYEQANPEFYKLAAGWLIEQCGWKGKRLGDVGVYSNHSLILVNYANANGKEIYELAKQITNSVIQKFDVVLEPEVNLIF